MIRWWCSLACLLACGGAPEPSSSSGDGLDEAEQMLCESVADLLCLRAEQCGALTWPKGIETYDPPSLCAEQLYPSCERGEFSTSLIRLCSDDVLESSDQVVDCQIDYVVPDLCAGIFGRLE